MISRVPADHLDNTASPMPGRPTRAGMIGAVRPVTKAEAVYSGAFLCALSYLLIEYGRPQSWLPMIGVIKPGMLALGAGMIALMQRGHLPKDRQARYLVAFVALMALSIPFALNRNRAFWQTWSMFLMVFGGVLPIALFVDSFARLQHVLRFWIIVHISLAVFAMTHAGAGIGSFLADENDLALAMNTALPYAITLVVLERGIALRLIAGTATFALIFASITTMSRGGFIGLACVAVMVWLQSKRKVVSLIGLAVLCASVYAFTPSKYWDEVATITNADQKGDTGYQRIYSWKIGWRMFLAHPIFGVGANNYPHRAHEYEDQTSDDIGYHLWGRAAHSLYFTLLPELGTVGTFLFAGMLLHGVRMRHRLRRTCKRVLATQKPGGPNYEAARWLRGSASAMDASLVGFMVTAIFISVLYYPHIWVLTGFSSALIRVGERFTEDLEPESPGAGRTVASPPVRHHDALVKAIHRPSVAVPNTLTATRPRFNLRPASSARRSSH